MGGPIASDRVIRQGFFGKDIPKLLIWFGYYVLEACGRSASCGFSKFLGDGLGCSDFL